MTHHLYTAVKPWVTIMNGSSIGIFIFSKKVLMRISLVGHYLFKTTIRNDPGVIIECETFIKQPQRRYLRQYDKFITALLSIRLPYSMNTITFHC